MALNLKNFIAQLPNNISGDGKNFVAILKKYLASLETGVLQEITDATAVTPVEQVTALSLSETHTFLDNLYPQNNIVVTFDHSNVTNYQEALVYASTNGGSSYYRAGNTTGTQCVMSNVTNGATYKIKVLAVNTTGTIANFTNAPVADITIVGASVAQSQATQLVLTWDKDGALWEWLHTPNAFTDFYELRLDDQAGTLSGNLLDRTRLLYSRVNPNVRSGIAYLFVRNIFGDYSVAATHSFSKAVENQPAVPTLTQLLNGIRIDMDAIPATANGVHLHLTINGTDTEEFDIGSNVFTYFRLTGTVVAKYCFTDDIGYGAYSETTTIVLKSQLASADIADGAIIADKIAANAITAAKIEANAVEADKILAGAITADKIAVNSITADKIQADAITGDKILAGSIIGDHISAGAISTDKLAAGSIALAGALKVVGGAVTLDENGLTIAESNGGNTKFNAAGITFYTASGIASGAIRKVVSGIANSGQYVKFTEAWPSAPYIIVSPKTAQTMVSGYTNSNIQVVCEAYSNDITNDPNMLTGFRVRLETRVLDATGGDSVNIALNSNGAEAVSPSTPNAAKDLYATVTCNLGSTTAGYYTADNPDHGFYYPSSTAYWAYSWILVYQYFEDNNGYLSGYRDHDNTGSWTHSIDMNTEHTHSFKYLETTSRGQTEVYNYRTETHYHRIWHDAVQTNGSATFAFYYKLASDSTWISAGSKVLSGYGDQTYTHALGTNLTPGIYQMKVVRSAGTLVNSASFALYSVNGGGVLASVGTVNFLAIQTDNNNYYTIQS